MAVDIAPSRTHEPYHVTVSAYIRFREQGFLAVRGLVSPEDVGELNAHVDNLIVGRERIPGVPLPPEDLSPQEKFNYYQRIHMPHRVAAIDERFLLHPRVLDVLEALIGPDVLALQTMLFFKQPGQPGQGYHQDAYYIPSLPDTLCGAWLALDPATEENGCLWFSVGSQHEPIYPDSDGTTPHGDRVLGDIEPIANASHTDESVNLLTRVARKYSEVKVEAEPGDVVFFGGHVIHRSHANRSKTQSRRSFVGHYCNARSLVPWNHGQPYEGDAANNLHILARGTTHLPYAQPRFGTLCAANAPDLYGQRAARPKAKSMMGTDRGFMVLTAHEEVAHED